MKQKYPSQLNTKVIRIGVGDYVLLREFSERLSVTMAEAFHIVIEKEGKAVPPEQIPMPIHMVARSMPTTTGFTREL